MAKQPATVPLEAGFRPRARILQLLGDELIGSPRLAVFELVKNAYDADARKVVVTLEHLNTPDARIVVTDDGSGMSSETIVNVWLTPADDHRRLQREAKVRSPLGRLPLGEKGLGRFAVHKLGGRIRMITRQRSGTEVVVTLDWSRMLSHRYLDEIRIPIVERKPMTFLGNKHGTRIVIEALRDSWTRGEIRDLHRSLTSIADPTSGPSDFQVELRLPGMEKTVEDLPDPVKVLAISMWTFEFTFDGNHINWTYVFRPYSGIKIEGAILSGVEPLLLSAGRKKVVADQDLILGIGSISGTFHVFDRDRETWNFLPQKQIVRDYLDNNGGVRIYRDGVRVYNYGEPDDDWLGLDLRRVNTPTRNISRNLVLGRINLKLDESFQLTEKTNREGFVENNAFDRLKEVVMSALSIFENKRSVHKQVLRTALTGIKQPVARSIDTPVTQLRKELSQRGLSTLVALVDDVKREYDQLREIMLNSGNAGLQLSLIFHELERGVRGLVEAIARRESMPEIEQRTSYLKDLLEGFATVLKKEPSRKHSLVKLAREAMFLNQIRFKVHQVAIDFPLGKGEQLDRNVRASRGLAIGAISNAIDNAIFWTRVRWPDDPPKGDFQRRIWVGSSDEYADGTALIVGDNGPGLKDPPDDLIRPFWSRRPGGMGLGLYYANLAMELSGGRLAFPDPREIGMPEYIDGAVVAFIFKDA
ncbi:ATP-binding protein [Methylobacterium marchantiae]|uniref:ATP-binding protein n=1 Tax=Methylobacterium marchantiae TaxID=600331 RepID=A0ABW3X364_9HYPH|nr:DNA mismatch repair protein MutL [Methylobacterium marchantiae]